MDDFPPSEERQRSNHNTINQPLLCDNCNDSNALLYCRADSAKLCFSCDRGVHSANQLFYKHTRSQLCDACGDSPASIFCSTESSVLCQNCDWERHNFSLPSVHDRRPLEGFTGCPSVTELLTFLGLENIDKKALFLSEESGGGGCDGFFGSGLDGLLGSADGLSDLLVWDTPSVISLHDLIVTNSDHNLQAMVVPPLPKNRNAACGKHMEEILSQLRQLTKVEPNLQSENAGTESLMTIESVVAERNLHLGDKRLGFGYDTEPTEHPVFEACVSHWGNNASQTINCNFLNMSLRSRDQESYADFDKNSGISDTVSHANGVHDGLSYQPLRYTTVLDKVAKNELSSQERETAISRYKEKKKTRRYDKHIRYQTRKVGAESRTRIKGRFAKTN